MDLSDEEIRTVWAGGKDWVIKRKDNQYFYRADRQKGEWEPGIPPDTFQHEIELLFDDE